ncbi:MAG: hypothetical protein AAFR84_13780 [Pseudomonadota bacterium]
MKNPTEPGESHASTPSPLHRMLGFLPIALMVIAVGLLARRVLGWLRVSIDATTSPLQIDYGEGVVWQQAIMIMRGEGYAPLAEEPYIVFHYPPVFHVGMWFTGLFTEDMLAGGRLFSILMTLLAAAVFGAIVFEALMRQRNPLHIIVAGMLGLIAAGLIVDSLPVASWGFLARVDMVALAAGAIAAWAGLRAHRQPAMVWVTAVFVAISLYSKQSFVALPAAIFGTMLLLSPRTALKSMGICLAIGLGTLAGLMVLSGGRFLTHVVGYNINPFQIGQLRHVEEFIAADGAVVLAGLGAMVALLVQTGSMLMRVGPRAFLQEMRQERGLHFTVFALLLFLAASATLPLVLKKGSNVNYLMEWVVALVMLATLALGRLFATRALTTRSPLIAAILVAVLGASGARGYVFWDYSVLPGGRNAGLDQMIAEAEKPVISEEMVAVLRAGKEVLWEGAIHGHREAFGRYDSTPLIERIERDDFAFFVIRTTVEDGREHASFPETVLAAIREHYPQRQRYGGYVAYLPSDMDPIGGEPLDPSSAGAADAATTE